MKFQELIPFYKRNLSVAIPVMLTQAGQVMVHLADNIMVGRVGTTELASVSFANSILILGMVFGIGFTQGVTPHVGQAYGKGEHNLVSKLLSNSFFLFVIISLFLFGLMYIAAYIMPYMGQTESVTNCALDYYKISVFSLPLFLVFFGLRQFSEGIGITKYAMYITLLANIINILLNWILIFGYLGFSPMGVKGAAIATLISRFIMLILFISLFLKLDCYNIYIKQIRSFVPKLSIIKRIFQTAVPLSFQNLVEITAFSASAIMVGWIGEVELASHQIAMTMSSFSFMLALGVGAAATIRVSHQFGSGDYRSMRIAAFTSIHLSVFLMSICGVLYIIFRHHIPIVYSQDSSVRYLAAQLLIVSALFQIFDAIQLASLASLRALADVKVPLVLSIISYYLICLPLGYFCGFILDYGAIGIWIGLLLGLVFASVLFLLRFHIISKKLISNTTI